MSTEAQSFGESSSISLSEGAGVDELCKYGAKYWNERYQMSIAAPISSKRVPQHSGIQPSSSNRHGLSANTIPKTLPIPSFGQGWMAGGGAGGLSVSVEVASGEGNMTRQPREGKEGQTHEKDGDQGTQDDGDAAEEVEEDMSEAVREVSATGLPPSTRLGFLHPPLPPVLIDSLRPHSNQSITHETNMMRRTISKKTPPITTTSIAKKLRQLTCGRG